MRMMMIAFALLGLACAVPDAAAAQCNDECVALTGPNGETGYGCVTGETGMSCIATTTRCKLSECKETFLFFSPGGQFAALINTCDLARATLPANGKLAQLTSSLAAVMPRLRSAARLART
jgi:hypothetical protein